MNQALQISQDALAEFCQRWRIRELALFGSALRDDFRADSDIDLLVSFAPDAGWSLLDHIHIQNELARLLGRPVDLVSRRAIERSTNPYRKREILESARTLYAA
jgi:predicted nucleotidyltransferase